VLTHTNDHLRILTALDFFEQRFVLLPGLGGQSLALEQVGEAESVGDIPGIQLSNALEQVEGFALEALLLTDPNGLLELAQGFRAEAHALEVVPEIGVRIEAGRIDLQDLLVDRDGLGVEPALREQTGDAAVLLDGPAGIPALDVQVTQLEPGVGVVGLSLEMLLVLLQGLVVAALLDVLLSILERLAFGQGEGQDSSSR